MYSGLTNSRFSVCRCVMLTLAAFLCSSLAASATITEDATSTQTGATASTTLTWNHTLGTGYNRAVVCTFAIANTDALIAPIVPTSMTFGGVAMTPVTIPATPSTTVAPTHAETSTARIETGMFYINDGNTSFSALSGVTAVLLTLPTAPSGPIVGGCTSLFGVNPAAPEAVGSNYSGSSTATTTTITTITANDWVIDSFGGGFGSSGSASQNTGQILLYNPTPQIETKSVLGSNAGVLAGSSYEQVATAGSVTTGWASASVARYAYVVAAFAPAAGFSIGTSVSPANSGTVTLNPSGGNYNPGTNV